MRNCAGIYLPDHEKHFWTALTTENKGRRVVEGLPTYGHDQLERAVALCKRRRIAVDVGAHVGMWSMWLVREFDRVEAFEPVSEYANIFPANVRGGSWAMHRVALGDKPGVVSMKTYPEDTGHTHVALVTDPADTVPIVTLDSFNYRDVDLIKIDVEGYEYPVVRGATRTIMEAKPIVVLEQRGFEKEHYGEPKDSALFWLTRCLGMRVIEQIHYDYILGW